ncbi:uncharacterized protein [Typha angustifolia]|uniref:uncharacterized protein n=1 Tax=Typha angustifolia TaxID=59011 RepID=UPI003C2C4301
MEVGHDHNKETRDPSDHKEALQRGEDDDDDDDDSGVGQFYNCTFCKRGFSSAQALGGHMNIHRKDRAKTKPSSSTSISERSKSSMTSSYYGMNTSYQSYPTYLSPTMDASLHAQRPQELSLFSDRKNLGLDMHIGYDEGGEDREEKEELDLELRLGHEP